MTDPPRERQPRSEHAGHPWGPFGDTVLHFTPPDGPSIDLRRPVSSRDRDALAAIGLEHPFVIITAQDPMGATQQPAMNERRADALRDEVARAGLVAVRVDACSPDFDHCEQSLAVALERESGVALARRYDQLAVFWFDRSAFWIVPACADGPTVRLPSV